MSERPVISEGVEIKSVKRLALIRVSVVFIIIGLMFFLPAGTLKYWQGWVYMIVIAIPMIFFGVYMFKHDPKLLERRMRIKEKREK